MSAVFQILLSLGAMTYLIQSHRHWFKRQDLMALNRDPFTYIFGKNCFNFFRDTALMLFGAYVFASYGLIILAFAYITYFALKFLCMAFIYGHVMRLHAKGKAAGVDYSTPPSTQPASKRVDIYA